MQRVSFFIDGFNLYHSICKYAPDCKFLDLKSLCSSKLYNNEKLGDIYYFSAIVNWDQNKANRHKKYISKLESTGVKVILGKFKKKDKYCPNCRTSFISHEEKQTDVNIALKIVEECVNDTFDKAILVSGDTDMIPSFVAARRLDKSRNKRFGVLFPIGKKTLELESYSDFSIKLSVRDLKNNLFVLDDNKSELINKG